MLIDDLYRQARSAPSDICEHLELLSRLSSLCDHVTEFGVRHGNSTAALLFGRPSFLVCYDRAPTAAVHNLTRAAQESGVHLSFFWDDVLSVDIEPTDFLFIDTVHTYEQTSAELRRHANRVRRFIAFHDTSTFGDQGEKASPEIPAPPGIWPAIAEFLRQNRVWDILFYYTNNNGLTVIKRTN